MTDDYILTDKAYALIHHIGTPNSLQRLKHAPPIGDGERVYAEKWAKENKRQPHLNSGCGTLELILHDWLTGTHPSKTNIDTISQRDAQVAASVIQWLGTNCGHAFVVEAEKKIEGNRQKRMEVARERWNRST